MECLLVCVWVFEKSPVGRKDGWPCLQQCHFSPANGLHHLRKNNFVHRDIKPGNIMRCQNPDGRWVIFLSSTVGCALKGWKVGNIPV